MYPTHHAGICWAEAFPASPHRTLTHESADALLRVIADARVQRAKVLVLTGGTDTWCVGGDLDVFGQAPDLESHLDELATRLNAVVVALRELDAVVITVVDGVAAGAGMPVAAAGDIVLASTRARFTLGYTKLGLTPDGGASLLSQSVGLHRTLYAALVNPVLNATAAQQHGLVAEVLPPDDLLPRARQLAEQLAAGSRESLAATKHLIRGQALPQAHEALTREKAALCTAARQEDAAEGIRAFLEKRPPRFQNE